MRDSSGMRQPVLGVDARGTGFSGRRNRGKDGRLYFLTYFVTPLSCASAV